MEHRDYQDFRDLLTELKLWQDKRRRRALLKDVFWEHRLLEEIDLDGAAQETAAELLQACNEFDEPTANGLSPLCALLAGLRDRGLASGKRKQRFESLIDRLGCETPAIDWPHDPYPGMLALDHTQAPIFFGRRAETQELMARLDTEQGRRLLLVAGASGSGKSSLVRAGLWASLQNPRETRIAGSPDWAITAMKPSEPANDPFQALMWGLAVARLPGFDNMTAEAERLHADADAFKDLVKRVLAVRPAYAEWLLILDQFEEFFTRVEPGLRRRFLDERLLPALELPRFRVVATVRSDFIPHCIAHPGLLAEMNADAQYAGAQFSVAAPGPVAMTRMIEGPVQDLSLRQPVALDPALTDHLVAQANGRAGGLALLAFALKDLYEKCRDKGSMELADFLSEDIGGLAGIIANRAQAAVARAGVETAKVLPRVFSRLLTVQTDGAATRVRESLACWAEDAQALALIDALADYRTRLLVLSDRPPSREYDSNTPGRSVEVAHEALFTAWPALKEWIDKRREALIRRPQVERDASRWDQAGRPDHLIPNPLIVNETRDMLEGAELWGDMAQAPCLAHYLARDDADELFGLVVRARAAGGDAAQRLPLVYTLTAKSRRAETLAALGEKLQARDPALGAWLRAVIDQALEQLGSHEAQRWTLHRLRLGDLLAALGDNRRGVGLRPDGLPDIAWQEIPAGAFQWQAGEQRRTAAYRIARYPLTNAQYAAFTAAEDYDNAEWWQEGYQSPEPEKSSWEQSNRPKVNVAWVEALAFCRWFTMHAREQGLIGPDEVIRLPTEYEWEKAARGTDGRNFPWGEDYHSGYANIDETYDHSGPLNLRETTAVGLYPGNRSLYGLVDCAGNVWEWCLNKYDDPEDTDTSGDAMRVLRGGSWHDYRGLARADCRLYDPPSGRLDYLGFRVVCAPPIVR